MNCSNFTAEQCAELADLTANNLTLNPELADMFLYSCLQMWAIGLTVGIILSLIRKLK